MLAFSLISCVYSYSLHMAIGLNDVAGERVYHVSWISGSLFCVQFSYIKTLETTFKNLNNLKPKKLKT